MDRVTLKKRLEINDGFCLLRVSSRSIKTYNSDNMGLRATMFRGCSGDNVNSYLAYAMACGE